MTRDEAKKLLVSSTPMNHIEALKMVAGLEVLGLLKLDPPARVERKSGIWSVDDDVEVIEPWQGC